MLSTLSATPHDQAQRWQAGRLGLASAIRHTSAQSREQDQPCLSADGRCGGVFAGYLLNPEELFRDLEAIQAAPKNRSDVAIALAAYEAWGDECAERFEGEFSFIVADYRAGRLFVARDHLGFVPLYYRQGASGLVLATDYRTLFALSDAQPEPDPLYLAQVMANRWYTLENTPWKGVKRVPRASTFTFDGQRIATHRYWEPPTEITIRYQDDRDYVEHYRDMLFDCLRRVSRSDLQVGVAVSGGLDSSALFCIADQLERKGRWQSPSFIGYSLAAAEGGNAFELPYARAAAAHINRPLTEVPLFDPDIDWYTQDAEWHRDIPIPSNGAMMLDMERRVVTDGGRVLINGSGGDEWLQGNEQYYREFTAEFDLSGYAKALRRDVRAMGVGPALKMALRHSVAELMPGPLRELIRGQLRANRRADEREPVWLSSELRQALAEAEEAYEATMPQHGVEWTKHNLVKSPFSDLTHAMMRRQRTRIGLESRHPMLSRAFIEFSMRTPAHIKRRGGVGKIIHRQAMEDILPQDILDRTTKANFTNTKIDTQFAAYVRDHAHETLSELCDMNGVADVLKVDFEAPEGDFWAWEIWGLYATAAFLYQSDCKPV